MAGQHGTRETPPTFYCRSRVPSKIALALLWASSAEGFCSSAATTTRALAFTPPPPATTSTSNGSPLFRSANRGRVSKATRRMSSVTTAEGTGVAGSSSQAVVVSAEAEEEDQEEEQRVMTKSALLGAFGEVAGGVSVADRTGAPVDASPGGADADAIPVSAFVDPVLACPSTLGTLTEGFRSYGGIEPGATDVRYKTTAKRPGIRYKSGGKFTDFVEASKPAWKLSRAEAIKEGTFQSPLVSWLYERGWRQGFQTNGFPGIDEEFRQVQEFFEGSEGGTVLDLSCGSGLMTRRLVASARYARVIGGDLSSTMLAETARRFKQDGLGEPELIRCDVSRLPIQTESVDGAHAGAALHCWSKLEESLSEVFRVLKPGKGFFATTFLTTASLNKKQQSSGFKFFELDELDRLMRDAGFSQVEVSQSGHACAIVRAVKAKQ